MIINLCDKDGLFKILMSLFLVVNASIGTCCLLLWVFIFQDDGDLKIAKLGFWVCLGLSMASVGAMISGDL